MANIKDLKHRIRSGSSLLELLITLSVAIIFLLLMITNFSHLWHSNKTSATLDQLISAINFTRNQAILNNASTIICGSSDQDQCDGAWSLGQIVKINNTSQVIRVYPALTSGDHLIWNSSLGKNNYLKFAPTGFTDGQDGSFYYCPKYSKSQYGAIIVVSLTGRLRIDSNPQDIQAACTPRLSIKSY